MDLEQIKYLSNEEKDRYAKLERLFSSDGWTLVEEWAKQLHSDATARVLSATSWDVNRVFTGARAAYNEVATLREATEEQFVQMAEAARAAAVIEEESKYE
jgi:hypothetical protein